MTGALVSTVAAVCVVMVEGKPYRYGLIAAGLCVASMGLFIMTQKRPHVYATMCALGVTMLCVLGQCGASANVIQRSFWPLGLKRKTQRKWCVLLLRHNWKGVLRRCQVSVAKSRVAADFSPNHWRTSVTAVPHSPWSDRRDGIFREPLVHWTLQAPLFEVSNDLSTE